MSEFALISDIETPSKAKDLAVIVKAIKAKVKNDKKGEIAPHTARTYIRVVKNLHKQFGELYTNENLAEILGISKSNLSKWKPNDDTIQMVSFSSSWQKLKLLAEIHISIAKLYQNKESIINVLIGENTVFDKSFYEVILSADFESMVRLKYHLEAIESR
jgi:transcriptional regulator with XRE-family HTH domain